MIDIEQRADSRDEGEMDFILDMIAEQPISTNYHDQQCFSASTTDRIHATGKTNLEEVMILLSGSRNAAKPGLGPSGSYH